MRLTSACRGIFLAGSCYWSLVFPCPAWALDGNHEAWAAFRQDNWTLTEKLTAGLADDPEAILLRANAASRAGNTDLARQVLEEGRKRFPQDARFVVNLSIVLSRDGKNEEAVQTIEGFFASRDDTRDAFRTLRTIQGRAAREAYGRALGVELETLPPLALLEPLVPKTIEPPSRNLVAASVAPSVPAPAIVAQKAPAPVEPPASPKPVAPQPVPAAAVPPPPPTIVAQKAPEPVEPPALPKPVAPPVPAPVVTVPPPAPAIVAQKAPEPVEPPASPKPVAPPVPASVVTVPPPAPAIVAQKAPEPVEPPASPKPVASPVPAPVVAVPPPASAIVAQKAPEPEPPASPKPVVSPPSVSPSAAQATSGPIEQRPAVGMKPPAAPAMATGKLELPVPPIDKAASAVMEAETAARARTAAWVKAWESRDFDRYRSFYKRGFAQLPGETAEAWVARRRAVLGRAGSIRLTLHNIAAHPQGGGVAVSFRQKYETPGVALSSTKTLLWEKQDGEWVIAAEIVNDDHH